MLKYDLDESPSMPYIAEIEPNVKSGADKLVWTRGEWRGAISLAPFTTHFTTIT